MKKNYLLSSILLATLGASLLAPASVFAAYTATTDGDVTFKAPNPENNGIVQPGTNGVIKFDIGADTGAGKGNDGTVLLGTVANGYVQLLFAPSFHFGTVEADYTNETHDYPVNYLKVTDDATGGSKETHYIAPFVQVADYSAGTRAWGVTVTASAFTDTTQNDTHVLAGTHIYTKAPELRTDQAIALDTTPEGGLSLRGADTAITTSSTPVIAHAATYGSSLPTKAVNGNRVSALFALAADTVANNLSPAGNNYAAVAGQTIANIVTNGASSTEPTTTGAVYLKVPRSDQVRIGRQYHSNLTWTLSATL
ncbi:MAG: WxL domain-containing protein [Lactobacillales bacterium]|jgi:hypothetical protein|nr:WxL domain-containing protein [Lactobacillales bacterium]